VSPRNDQIQNYWPKLSQLNAIIAKPEAAPDWMTTGITYLIPKAETTDPLHA
jgi:hypothetical protein